jgi:hypothetical protein
MWGQLGATALSAAGSYFGGKSGQPGKYGAGYDFINKDIRPYLKGMGADLNSIYSANKSGLNDWMTQGLQGLYNLGETYQPMIDYGNSMLGLGGQSAQGAMGAANAMMGFNPYTSNQQYQSGQAYGPQYDYGTAMGMMSMAPSFINPMLQSIAGMNQRTLGENLLPGMAGSAIGSGNTTSSKWGTNNAVLQRGMMDANAQAAAQMYGNIGNQALQTAGQYGLSAGDWLNQMSRLNTTLGNQLGFEQGMQNAEMQNRYGLGALSGAANIYGNMMSNTNPYFSALTSMYAGIPQSQYQAGKMQMMAPTDWLTANLGPMLQIGTAGSPSSTTQGGTPNNQMGGAWGSMFGQLASDLWGSWNPGGGGDPYGIGVNRGTYNGPT